MVHLTLLGPVRVTQPPEECVAEKPKASPRFRSRRTIALLGYLALERRPAAREYLAALFWPDEEPAAGRSNLRRELYNLAQILPGCWQTEPQTVAFSPADHTSVDIDLIVDLQGQEHWQEAAELLGGEFLEGVHLSDNERFESWLLAERERWRERSCTILRHAAAEQSADGRFADALSTVRLLLQRAPWDEAAQRQAMCLLDWIGRREEALRQFAACRQVLAEELGVEPAAETAALYEEIAAGELQPPPAVPAFLRAAAAGRPERQALFVMRERPLAWLDGHLARALTGQSGILFITGGAGQGKTTLLDAFTAHALQAHPDCLVARGSCAAYAGVGDPYLPFRDIMAMLCGDVEARWSAGAISTTHARCLWQALPLVVQAMLAHGPGLLDTFVSAPDLLQRVLAAAPGDGLWLQPLTNHLQLQAQETSSLRGSALFQQFSNVLRNVSNKRPLLLILDDLQWVDAASIALLFHLVRRMTANQSRILIVCAYRPQEIMRDHGGAHHRLAAVLSEFKRLFGDVWLSLNWSAEEEGQQFVNSVLDSEPNNLDQAFREALFHRTGGHPLFTLELLRAMRDRGQLVLDADGRWQEGTQLDWQMIPARVEAVIAASIQQLDPELHELLAIASVEGELFTAQVAAHVQKLPEATLLRRLAQDLGQKHGLVREQELYQLGSQSITRYRFRHALFQEYLYRQLTAGEKRLLHGAVALAIESLFAPDLDSWSVQLAGHFDRGGSSDRALTYYTRAAQNAAKVYAYDETIAHYRRALTLARSTNAPPGETARLYHGLGLAHETKGAFDLARADFERALELGLAAGEAFLEWQVLLALGKLWSSRDYTRARGYLWRALDLARRLDDPLSLGRSLNRAGNWLANDEQPAQALLYHREALQIFEEIDDRPNLANTLDLLGIACLLTGDSSDSAAAYYDRAIHLFRELGDYPRLISSLTARALIATGPVILATAPAHSALCDPLTDLDEALQIARRIGSAPDEAWCAWARALLHTVGGDFGQALQNGRRGLQIALAIEHREWQVGNRYALGIIYNELLQPELALTELEQALLLAQELRSQYWVNHVSGALAKSYLLQDNLPAAEQCLAVVIAPGTAMDTAGRRTCWARSAELALARGDPAHALHLSDRLIDSAAGLAPDGVITIIWLLQGEALTALGRPDEARERLVAGIKEAQERRELFLWWRYHAALARLDRADGHEAEANEQLAAARQQIEELAEGVEDEGFAAVFRHRALERLPHW